NREAEKATTEKATSDVTSWLTEQAAKQPAAGPSTPLPAAPPLPGERRKMMVMLGAEMIQVEIPGEGQLPIVTPQSRPADLGGDQGIQPAEGPGGFDPVPPTPDGDEGSGNEPDAAAKEGVQPSS